MAIIPGNNVSSFLYLFRNEDHRTNIGLDTYVGTQFPAMGMAAAGISGDFTFSCWIWIGPDETFTPILYSGPNGPLGPIFWRFYSDTTRGGQDLYWQSDRGDGILIERRLDNVVNSGWMYICYRKQGNLHDFFSFREDSVEPIRKATAHTGPLDFPFDQFTLDGNSTGYCSVKIWNVALSDAQIDENKSIWFNPTGAPPPIWMAHLRRPGDTYNHAAGLPNDFWHDNFEWTLSADPALLKYLTDPVPLQKAPCSTFLIPTTDVDGALPRVPEFQCPQGFVTVYALDSTYFQVEDRSTIPLNYPTTPTVDRVFYDGAILYGFAPYQGIKRQIVPANSVAAYASYAAYRNPAGVKAETLGILDQTGYVVTPILTDWNPADLTAVKIEEIYLWKWGAGFGWNNTLGVIAKAYPGEYRQPVILVTYRGTWLPEVIQESTLRISQLPVEIAISPRVGEDPPTTIIINPPPPPPVVPTVPGIGGIYFFNPAKLAWHDSYYPQTGTTNNIEVKIPDPTIRTALIGE